MGRQAGRQAEMQVGGNVWKRAGKKHSVNTSYSNCTQVFCNSISRILLQYYAHQAVPLQ